jgi:hypothetical protein
MRRRTMIKGYDDYLYGTVPTGLCDGGLLVTQFPYPQEKLWRLGAGGSNGRTALRTPVFDRDEGGAGAGAVLL